MRRMHQRNVFSYTDQTPVCYTRVSDDIKARFRKNCSRSVITVRHQVQIRFVAWPNVRTNKPSVYVIRRLAELVTVWSWRYNGNYVLMTLLIVLRVLIVYIRIACRKYRWRHTSYYSHWISVLIKISIWPSVSSKVIKWSVNYLFKASIFLWAINCSCTNMFVSTC